MILRNKAKHKNKRISNNKKEMIVLQIISNKIAEIGEIHKTISNNMWSVIINKIEVAINTEEEEEIITKEEVVVVINIMAEEVAIREEEATINKKDRLVNFNKILMKPLKNS